MIVVVDASIALKWYGREADSDQAAELLEGDHVLIAPAHVFGEIGEVLCRRLRDSAIGREQLDAALAGARRSIVAMSLDDLLADATSIALEAATSFYDALYVATAGRWNAPLVTADEKLVRKLSGTRWSTVALKLGEIDALR